MWRNDTTQEENLKWMGAFTHGLGKWSLHIKRPHWRSLHIHWVVPSDRPCGVGVIGRLKAQECKYSPFSVWQRLRSFSFKTFVLIMAAEENPLRTWCEEQGGHLKTQHESDKVCTSEYVSVSIDSSLIYSCTKYRFVKYLLRIGVQVKIENVKD